MNRPLLQDQARRFRNFEGSVRIFVPGGGHHGRPKCGRSSTPILRWSGTTRLGLAIEAIAHLSNHYGRMWNISA